MRILIVTKKLKSRRIFDVLRKMATALAIFSATFFCALLLKAESIPGRMAIVDVDRGREGSDQSVTSRDSERDMSNVRNPIRYHRTLHFTKDGEQSNVSNNGDRNVIPETSVDGADKQHGDSSILPMKISSEGDKSLREIDARDNSSRFGNIQPEDGYDSILLSKLRSLNKSESILMEKLSHFAVDNGATSSHSRRMFPRPNRNAARRNTSEIPVQRLPQAIIIGVKKSGTRALLEFLRIHPDVEGTGPEPHFFDRNYEKGLDWYRSLMPMTYKGQITVEKTPSYFITKEVPRRIFKMNPEVKLLLVVRDPVTRAISDYCQAASKRPVRSFEEMALLNERKGLVNTSWNAIKIGVYAKHIQKWLRIFRRDQMHFVDGQALIAEPAKELAKVENFLGLPNYINGSHFHLNAFKGTFPCLHRRGKVHCLDERTKGRDHPKVKDKVLQSLKEYYSPLNAKFFEIIGQKFDWSA